MTLIFIDGMTNIVSNAGQYRCVVNWSLVINETHMCEPPVREGNDKVSECLIPLNWQYQTLEKSRDRRASVRSRVVVVGHRNLKMTPFQIFSLDGNEKGDG
ncbi:hypothetical protein PS15m_012331 [Mucor circinelloides]